MKILAIHGAWSSSTSFNYLKSKIKTKNWHCIDYDHRVNSWEDILNMSSGIMREPYIAIGHSLGGLVALHQTNDILCKGIVTIASPLAGLDLNLIQLYLSRASLISKISNNSTTIRNIHEFEYQVPVLHLIANRGYNPFIYEDNDGVLSIKVQTGWSCGEISEISANHYEILQSEATATALLQFLKQSASM
jgi:pimeloyl-ACP methyl ester carboxylesterase